MFGLILQGTGVCFVAVAICIFVYEWLLVKDSHKSREGLRHRLGVRAQSGVHKASFLEGLKLRFAGNLLQKANNRKIKATYERDLPACLEVIALGMHAGMGFDQAFELYTARFDNLLAKRCKEAYSLWQRGLKRRDTALRDLGEEINTKSFKHFCTASIRALRFGSPMAPMLINLAEEARKDYRSARQEIVAKAPVKMLLPTGALILPAMLLLVMGPIFLDLTSSM